MREDEKGKFTARFFCPVMKNGVVSFPMPEDCDEKDRRIIRDSSIKVFGEGNFIGANEFSEGGVGL